MSYLKYETESELYHHGIKGQKWGVRRYRNTDGSLTSEGKKHYKGNPKKDAKEFARAKMYYGDGAGTRRKLIKAKVEELSKDPEYKKKFDEYLAKQDMSKHAEKAKKERKRNDNIETVKKNSRGIVNILTGHPERIGASLAALAAAWGVAHKFGLDKKLVSYMKKGYNQAKNSEVFNNGKQYVDTFVNKVKRR